MPKALNTVFKVSQITASKLVFSRCKFRRLASRSGFERIMPTTRAWAGQGWDRATEFFETATSFCGFFSFGGSFKYFVLLAIEVPVAQRTTQPAAPWFGLLVYRDYAESKSFKVSIIYIN